jgi:hypothetical protein
MRTLGEPLQVSSCCTKSSGEPKNGHRSQARTLIQSLDESAFSETATTREGYRVVEVEGHYAGLKQRWIVVESDNHAEGDLNQLEKRLDRECKEAERALKTLGKRLFGCETLARRRRSWRRSCAATDSRTSRSRPHPTTGGPAGPVRT